LEQRRREAVVAQPSERRNRRPENEANRVELRDVMSMPPTDAATTTSQLATPRGADNDLSGTRDPCSASTLRMFSPAVSTSAREPGPSTATVDSDAARVTELNRGNQSRHVQEAHQESTGSSLMHPLCREELIPDSMRNTILANLETKTLKIFRKIFAHHKNAHAKILDWVSYIPVELHTQVRARIRSVVDPKTDEKQFTAAQVDNWQSMDMLTVLDVLIEPNAAALVDGNSLVAALENIELVPSEFFVSRYYETLEHQLSTIYRQFMLVYEDSRHEESAPQVRAMERAFKKSFEGQRLNKLIREMDVNGFLPRTVGAYMNAAEGLASEAEAALRKARKYADAAGGKPSAPGAGTKRRQQAPSSKQKCPGCGIFDHVHQECFYRLHPYFNKDPSIEFAQSSMGIRYFNKYWGRYIKERDMDPTMPKNDYVRRIFPGFRVNLLVANGRYREAESSLSTVAAISRSERTLPCISRLINAIAGLESRIRTPAVKSSTIGVERQRALAITDRTMPKIGIAARTTAKIGNGIATKELSETQGVVAETLLQIVAATPERKWTITRSARGFAGQEGRSRHKGKAPRLLSSPNAGSIRQL
jgi:hypothetical protein